MVSAPAADLTDSNAVSDVKIRTAATLCAAGYLKQRRCQLNNMKTCEDCIHFDVCFIIKDDEERNLKNSPCKHFKGQSLVLELPCKFSDDIYIITVKQPCHACLFCTEICHQSCRVDDKNKRVVKRARVCSIELGAFNHITAKIEETEISSAYNYTFWFEDFGYTVFRTREAAERALKGGAG